VQGQCPTNIEFKSRLDTLYFLKLSKSTAGFTSSVSRTETSLVMGFTTGGTIVLVGKASNVGIGPSATESYPKSQGFRKRRSHLPNLPAQQEQDELELNPNVLDRPASTIRTSDDSRQGSIESYVASQEDVHVSRRYEVSTEEMNRSEMRKMALSACSGAVTSN
jgi:hypothetical protein